MSVKQRFRGITNYAVYYGRGEAEALSHYDAVIVEPSGQSPENVAQLRARGTLVLAYVSVVEIPEYDPLFAMLAEDDFMRDDEGRRMRNDTFGGHLADLSSVRWQGLLKHRIGKLLRLDGYDGVFFDTIGDLEWPNIPPSRYKGLLRNAGQFVKSVRELHPDALLVQNNGLNALCEETAPWLDGICWENPDFTDKASSRWHAAVWLRLRMLVQNHPITILLLNETDQTGPNDRFEHATRLAEQPGIVAYGAPPGYVGEVRMPINRKVE